MKNHACTKLNLSQKQKNQGAIFCDLTGTDNTLDLNELINSTKISRSCVVCGEDSWCGSDGCPLDPQ